MTDLDPEASGLLDGTPARGARRGALSQREKVTGRAFDRQIGSTKRGDRYADCRIGTEFAFDRHNRYATRDRKWSSGDSRIRPLLLSVLAASGPLHRHAPARYCRREPKWLL